MPVYNAATFLAESIESILKQSYQNFEFIILDDGSTDNSLAVIQSYAKKDSRIKVLVNQTNKNNGVCRNILLKNVTTEFIAWMDADDLSLTHRLKVQLDFLNNNPAIDIVCSNAEFFGGVNYIAIAPTSDLQIKTRLLIDNPIIQTSSMLRMTKLRNIFYNDNTQIAVDYQYWVDCCSLANFRKINKVLVKYRNHSQQISSTKLERRNSVHLKIVQKHLAKFGIKANTEELYNILINSKQQSVNYQKLKKEIKLIKKILAIKSFYFYASINKNILLKSVYNLLYRQLGFIGILYFLKDFGVMPLFLIYEGKITNFIMSIIYKKTISL